MSNYMINSMLKEVSNMAVLSVKPYDETDNGRDAAAEVGKIFLQSVALLKKEQFLGLQIKWDEKGKSQACVFSSIDVGVTAEDFGWMFQKCAYIGSFSADSSVIRHGDSDKMYELLLVPENAGEKRDGCGNRRLPGGNFISWDYFQQLLNEMKKTRPQFRLAPV